MKIGSICYFMYDNDDQANPDDYSIGIITENETHGRMSRDCAVWFPPLNHICTFFEPEIKFI